MTDTNDSVGLLLRRTFVETADDVLPLPGTAERVRERHSRGVRLRAVAAGGVAVAVVAAGAVFAPQVLSAGGETVVVPSTGNGHPLLEDEPTYTPPDPAAVEAAAAAVWSMPDEVYGVTVTWLPEGFLPRDRHSIVARELGANNFVGTGYAPADSSDLVSISVDRSGLPLLTSPDDELYRVHGQVAYLSPVLDWLVGRTLSWRENDVNVHIQWTDEPDIAALQRIAEGTVVHPVVPVQQSVVADVQRVTERLFPYDGHGGATADDVAATVVDGESLREAVDEAWRSHPEEMASLSGGVQPPAFLSAGEVQTGVNAGFREFVWDAATGEEVDLRPDTSPDENIVFAPVVLRLFLGDDGTWRATRESYCAAVAPLVVCPPSS